MPLTQSDLIVLRALSDGRERETMELAASVGLDQAAVARAALALLGETYTKQRTDTKIVAELTRIGRDALEQGLAETRLVKELEPMQKNVSEIMLSDKGVALGWAKKKGYVLLENGMLSLTEKGRQSTLKKEPEIVLLKTILNGDVPSEKELFLLRSRKLADYSVKTLHYVFITKKGLEFSKGAESKKEVSELTPELLKDKKWEKVTFRKYDVSLPVAPIHHGRRHFVAQAMEYMRKIYLEMGFKEMEGSLINTAFWNFDALFTAQDHPVRDMQDTFYLDPLKGRLPAKKTVDAVKKAHESGTPDSKGWQYKWNAEDAKRIALRTHTTVLSAQTLARMKKNGWPAKYFAIGKCFRNETLDWSHLFEFNQFEGIVIDKDANFRHLLGYLKEFFKKLGFSKARFRPAYFPYTEMSIEIDVFHPVHKKWLELGGAGIFRPEVVEPLLGEFVPVLAWGPGFDRILMDYYKITDIRDLYKNDVKQLRGMKQWMW
ncbi:MAG: phenylalanine--tRNA ligase subunit alpha [Candidatus Aenigmarchaeota archaeon]|nr:phenylalanine--tRNA ligase subunit alpha [Candidatus Aenigmarchaeota archaeon]